MSLILTRALCPAPVAALAGAIHCSASSVHQALNQLLPPGRFVFDSSFQQGESTCSSFSRPQLVAVPVTGQFVGPLCEHTEPHPSVHSYVHALHTHTHHRHSPHTVPRRTQVRAFYTHTCDRHTDTDSSPCMTCANTFATHVMAHNCTLSFTPPQKGILHP